MGSIPRLKYKCSEYVTSGRFFCSALMQEGEALVKATIDLLGEEVLMYASDYPHPECRFPHSPDEVLGWSSLGEETMRKLMWGNASRFYER